MSDQKKWFKVWTSILSDPDFSVMPLEDWGRWLKLSALIAFHGYSGSVTVTLQYFREYFEYLSVDEIRLPNVDAKCVDEKVVLTLKNWSKYQLFSESYERVARFREKQKEGNVTPVTVTTVTDPLPDKIRIDKNIKDILSPKKASRPPQKTIQEDSISYRLASLLLEEILKRKPDYRKPNLQEWAKPVELMLRKENRKPETIERVIRWCQVDDFWQDNILSTEKLREKFDRLELKMGKVNGMGSFSESKGIVSGPRKDPPLTTAEINRKREADFWAEEDRKKAEKIARGEDPDAEPDWEKLAAEVRERKARAAVPEEESVGGESSGPEEESPF